MPRVVYDESNGLNFIQSGHLQRNHGGSPPPTGFHNQTITIGRTSEGNVNALFDAYITCRLKSFADISAPGMLPGVRSYNENDFPQPGMSVGDPCIDTVRWETFAGQPITFERGPVGCPGPAALVVGAPPNIWNPAFFGGGAEIYYAAYNQEMYCGKKGDVSVKTKAFLSNKARVMLGAGFVDPRVYNGFLARATSIYATDANGIRTINNMTGIVIEQIGPFAPNVWINIPQPLEFNVDVFRFLVLYETVAEWQARTGYGV